MDSRFDINNNYHVFRQDRAPGKLGGGVCILAPKQYNTQLIDNFTTTTDHFDVITVSIDKSLVLCNIYRAPQKHLQQTIAFIESLLAQFPDAVIVGDLNVTLPNHKFEQLCKSHGLNQFVTSPTYNTGHPNYADKILDMVLCANDNIVQNCGVGEPFGDPAPLPHSDHKSLYLKCVVESKRAKYEINKKTKNIEKITKKESPAESRRLDWKNADYNLMCEYFASYSWPDLFNTCANVQQMYTVFINICLLVINCCVPVKSPRQRQFKLSKRTIRAAAVHRRLAKRARTSGRVCDRFCANLAASAFTNKRRNEIEQNELRYLRSCKQGVFWNYIKRKLGRAPVGVPAFRDRNGVQCATASDKCNALADQFASVLRPSVSDNSDNNSATADNNSGSLNNILIDENSVLLALSAVNTSRTPGPDSIPNCFLHYMAQCLAEPLCSIFNVSLGTGALPAEWKTAIV